MLIINIARLRRLLLPAAIVAVAQAVLSCNTVFGLEDLAGRPIEDTGNAGVEETQTRLIALGATHTCASTPSWRCWGSNDSGELGDGTTSTLPRSVAGNPIPLHDGVAELSLGDAYSCARFNDRTAQCWGKNDHGALGDGTMMNRPSPTGVSSLTDVAQIAAGGLFEQDTCVLRPSPPQHSCARLFDGTVRCWGDNREGQLGDGTLMTSTTPVKVKGLEKVTAIALRRQHTCALLATGTVMCWGANANGQLGDGTAVNSSTPTPVVGLADVVQIAVGAAHTCARKRDRTVWCWGLNDYGQLGIGTAVEEHRPRQTTNLVDVVEVALGGGHSCARLLDGSVKCWGANAADQLGFKTTTACACGGTSSCAMTPEPVPGLAEVTDLALGARHTCVRVKAGGTVKCWGQNVSGQLGDGTTDGRAVPTDIKL